MNKDKLISTENEYVMQTYARNDVVIEKGLGAKVFDTEGKEYLDMTSGIGVNSLGYNNKNVVEAIKNQAEKLLHISNLYYSAPFIELAKKLVDITKMSRVFFSNSGAEANEGAIKIARKYSVDKYCKDRYKILTLKNSFHGRTVTTLAATGQEKFHKYFLPLTEGFLYTEPNNIDNFKSMLNSDICAVMLEAVQGEGGVHPLKKEYVEEVMAICKEKDILVIFDEVQCGVGRTGKFFGYENFGVMPDIVTMAKGLGGGVPIGAFLCNAKLANVLHKGDHGSTFGGNPLACSAGLAVIDTIGKEEFISEVAKKGNYLINKIKALKSQKIKEVRGIGLLVGVELTEEANKYIQSALKSGVLFLSAGPKVVRMLPPLIISYEEIDYAVEVLEKVLT